jgi:hypothetical protein
MLLEQGGMDNFEIVEKLNNLSPASSIVSGRKVLTQDNVATALVASSTPCKWIEIQVLRSNVADIAFGGSNVSVVLGSETGIVFISGGGQSNMIKIDDVSKIYIVGTTGDGVSFNYFN